MISWIWAMLWFTFVVNPRGATLVEGDFYQLKVKANRPSTYQWYKDGRPIPGATNGILTIHHMLEGDAGVYVATATHDGSTIETRPEVIAYRPLIRIRIDGNMVTLTPQRSGSKIHYTTDGSEPTTNSTLYSGPFKVQSWAELRACIGNIEMDSVIVRARKGSESWTR